MKAQKVFPLHLQLSLPVLVVLYFSIITSPASCYYLAGNINLPICSHVTSGHQLKDLQTNDSTNFAAEAASWSRSSAAISTTIYTQCVSYIIGGHGVLGGSSQYGKYFERTYTGLPSHNMIYFDINFQLINSWDHYPPDYFEIHFDSKVFRSSAISQRFSLSVLKYCGVSGGNGLLNIRMNGKLIHAGTSVTLKVVSRMDGSTQDESFGFRDVSLSFVPNPPNTTESACYPYSASSAPAHFVSYCACSQGQYWDSHSSACLSCDSLCDNCFGAGSNQCATCAPGTWLDGSNCVECTTKTMPFYINGLCVSPCDVSSVMAGFIADVDYTCKSNILFITLSEVYY